MAFIQSAVVTFTLPTTYADGTTPWPAANYGSATVFRNGSQIGTVTGPALTYTDALVPIGTNSYTVEVIDKVTNLTSAASAAVTYTQVGQPPGAPVITSIVAT